MVNKCVMKHHSDGRSRRNRSAECVSDVIRSESHTLALAEPINRHGKFHQICYVQLLRSDVARQEREALIL